MDDFADSIKELADGAGRKLSGLNKGITALHAVPFDPSQAMLSAPARRALASNFFSWELLDRDSDEADFQTRIINNSIKKLQIAKDIVLVQALLKQGMLYDDGGLNLCFEKDKTCFLQDMSTIKNYVESSAFKGYTAPVEKAENDMISVAQAFHRAARGIYPDDIQDLSPDAANEVLYQKRMAYAHASMENVMLRIDRAEAHLQEAFFIKIADARGLIPPQGEEQFNHMLRSAKDSCLRNLPVIASDAADIAGFAAAVHEGMNRNLKAGHKNYAPVSILDILQNTP